MKRVLCLYRVSTIGQVDHDDIPMQRVACREFIDRQKDWTLVDEVLEKGVSGYKTKTADRDALTEIKAKAMAKKFDILLVFMFDRLGRREDETPFVVQWFVENGIEVWSAKEGQQRFDTHVDKLLNYIRFWQASGESEKTSLRIRTKHLQMIQEGRAITLRDGNQTISLSGLKAALLFIDAQQKRVGSETAWIKKGDEPPLSVPPAPALKEVAVVNPTPTPLSREERNDLLDYGNWRMNGLRCSLDPLRREVNVTALTDDKALMMISCEAGAYNTIDLAWIVSRKKPLASRPVRLRLPFNNGQETNELELMNATFDEKSRELVTLAKGRGLSDCGIQARWRFDGQRFRLVRYAAEPTCDNWHGPDAWPTLWITR